MKFMRGQTLIEALIAFGLIATVITGITILATNSLSSAQHSKNQTLATQYSQEGLEVIRQIRNSDYDEFASFNTPASFLCLDPVDKSLTPYSDTCSDKMGNDYFIRKVKIENNTGPPPDGCGAVDVSRASVIVSWSDGKCESGALCHSSESRSCLSTLNPIQGP